MSDAAYANHGNPILPRNPADGRSSGPITDLTALRLILHRNGYRPLPITGPDMTVKGAGKACILPDWRNVCAEASEETVANWTTTERNFTNTGILTGRGSVSV